MKRIIIFTPTLITGGAEKFVVDLAVNMDRDYFDVTIAAVSGILPEGFAENEFASVLKANHIEVVDLKGRNKFETAANIHRLFREKRPDIIHTNLSTILYVMFFAAIFDTETRLFTFHNVAGLTAQGFKKQLYRFAFRILHFTPVAICDFVRDTIAMEYGISSENIPCVYNGVNTKTFCPEDLCSNDLCLGERPEPQVIEFVNVGILYHLKNHKLLIDAFAMAEAIHPDIRLNIIGDGELREQLERQIEAYGLSNKIRIWGITGEVVDFLKRADVYMMSSDSEGLPLSVLEAMSCGLPVITTAAGGVVDIVKAGVNGFVTPVGEEKPMSEAMIELIRNEKLRKKMGEASRKTALKLSIDNCVEKYQRLYLNGKPEDSTETGMVCDVIQM